MLNTLKALAHENKPKMIDLLLGMVTQQKETNMRLEQMDKRFESMEKAIFKNTAAIGELRILVMRLADNNLRIDDIERRLKIVEHKLAS